jgi:hypothetical protein
MREKARVVAVILHRSRLYSCIAIAASSAVPQGRENRPRPRGTEQDTSQDVALRDLRNMSCLLEN